MKWGIFGLLMVILLIGILACGGNGNSDEVERLEPQITSLESSLLVLKQRVDLLESMVTGERGLTWLQEELFSLEHVVDGLEDDLMRLEALPSPNGVIWE